MSAITTTQTITSPNMIMNAAPPILTASTTVTTNISSVIAKMDNSIIYDSSLKLVFIIHLVIVAYIKRKSLCRAL